MVYVLRLPTEAPNHVDPLEILIDGDVPRQDDILTLEKEHPHCRVTYKVTSVTPTNIKIPKKPVQVYPAELPVVTANREPGGYERL